MTKDTGGPAFPEKKFAPLPGGGGHWTVTGGMTLRDWFATFAPQPRQYLIEIHERSDKLKNPHNDSYKPKLRSRAEIIAVLRYEFADAMLAERSKP